MAKRPKPRRSTARRSSSSGGRDYPRTARLNELLREILAEALEVIDDDRLQMLTITGVDVDRDISRAIVYFDTLQGEEGDEVVLEALGGLRVRLQATINREAHLRRTPELVFRPDPAVRAGARIDELLREIEPGSDVEDGADEDDRARRRILTMDGVVVVDKPAGWTSHDVVARCRKLLGTKKVGHSGTLDPDATGILLIGVGRVTRLLRFLTALPKTYTCEIVFGTETSTLDAAGEVTAQHDMTGLAPDRVVEATRALVGDILQVPPMVSAVKVDGRRLHELAREGKEVEREARPVHVYRFDVAPTDDPLVYTAEVECSSGTYVRTLAADLGTALGGGAHLRELRRTAIGSFGVDGAVPLDAVEPGVLLPPAEGLRDYPAVVVDEAAAVDVSHGRPVLIAEDRIQAGPPAVVTPLADVWRVLDETGRLLGIYEGPVGQAAKASVVLTPAGQ